MWPASHPDPRDFHTPRYVMTCCCVPHRLMCMPWFRIADVKARRLAACPKADRHDRQVGVANCRSVVGQSVDCGVRRTDHDRSIRGDEDVWHLPGLSLEAEGQDARRCGRWASCSCRVQAWAGQSSGLAVAVGSSARVRRSASCRKQSASMLRGSSRMASSS